MRRSALLVLLFVTVLAATALADTLYLKNGSKFEGKVIRETATHVYFKIRGLGEQPFKKSDIVKIEKGESVFDQYERRRKELKREDAEGFYQLGIWCQENSLRKQAKRCFETAVAADGDHAGARGKLDFVKYGGEWITRKHHAEILVEIAEREAGILAGLKLGDPHEDTEVLFSIGAPKGWKKEAQAGWVTFTGPDLGLLPVILHFELTDLADSLEEFTTTLQKTLKRIHEDLEAKGEPEAAKLASTDAKLLRFGYTEEGARMERAELLMVGPQGGHRLYLECADGYFDRLRPFFIKVANSVKHLDKPADLTAKEGGYSLSFPDDTYVKIDHFPIQIQGSTYRPPEGTCTIRNKTTAAMFSVVPGKKGDGLADATSLSTLKAYVVKCLGLEQLMVLSGIERKASVAGQEALMGDLQLELGGGAMGSGHWAIFMKGERYFVCTFVNFRNIMGATYAKEDFNKFLAGFKILE